jgi:fatty acid-binding protein DegV
MNVGLVVDATCDIPSSILERYKVHVLPTSFSIKAETTLDYREPETSLEFYSNTSASKLATASAHSCTAEVLISRLKEDLLYHHDHLLIVAPHLKLSNTLQNFREAILLAQPEFEQLRRAAHIRNSFKIRIIESQTGYAGYGLALYEALRLMGEKARSVDQLKKPLDAFKQRIETFILPGHEKFNHQMLADPPYNMSWVTLKKLQLSNTIPSFRVVENGIVRHHQFKRLNVENDFLSMIYDELTRTKLDNHLVNISFAGNLAQLRVNTTFKALSEHIKNKGGKLVYSSMSPTSAAQLGLGAISVAFAGKN